MAAGDYVASHLVRFHMNVRYCDLELFWTGMQHNIDVVFLKKHDHWHYCGIQEFDTTSCRFKANLLC